MREPDATDGSSRRRAIERASRRAELLAAVVLVLKGYRILGRRVRTHQGEIDIVAVRGRRLAFVEVKQRPTFDLAAEAVTPRMAERLARAAEAWVRRNPRYAGHRIGMDRFDVAGVWRCRHVEDVLHRLG